MQPFRPHQPPASDQLLVVFSDIEMGAGGRFDDFPHSDFLGELIVSYNEAPYDRMAVDLVFNGDTFDLLKTPYRGSYPRHITREVALGKLAAVAAAHPRFFEAVQRFVQHRAGPRRVFFIVGNHDHEIVIPEVRAEVRRLCGDTDRVVFPGLSLEIGKVRIEHGAQDDPLFRVEPQLPMVPFDGTEVLNISWGAAALLDTVIPLQPLLHFHDRLKPKKDVFRILPEVKELLIGIFWRYWLRDYWKGYFAHTDPTRKLTWTMVKELVWRFSSQDPDVQPSSSLESGVLGSDEHLVHLIGHKHEAGWWSHGDRKLLRTGGFRNEYMLLDGGRALRAIQKTYAEVYLRGDMPVRSHLVELEGPVPPPNYVPESIFDVLPAVRELLGEAQQRQREEREQHEQEHIEAEQSKSGVVG